MKISVPEHQRRLIDLHVGMDGRLVRLAVRLGSWVDGLRACLSAWCIPIWKTIITLKLNRP